MQLKQGTLLQGGKYRIEKVLGQGGFGITYLADNTMLDGKVAIKEFFFKDYCERDNLTSHVTIGTSGNRDMVNRFKQKFIKEARTIFKLAHPNIVHILDVFEENETAYYVMEYLENGSLADKVKHEGFLSEESATCYILQIADALDYIHKKNMNHLDIKPSNIMLNVKNEAVLIDFGLSKQYDVITGTQTSTTPVGISEGYAPMEQYKQGGVREFSPQTDIYALGATFFKLLTGITPPSASDVNNDGVPIEELEDRGVSQHVADAICKAMESRKRYRLMSIDGFRKLISNPISLNLPESIERTILTEDPIVVASKTTKKLYPIKKWVLALFAIIYLSVLGTNIYFLNPPYNYYSYQNKEYHFDNSLGLNVRNIYDAEIDDVKYYTVDVNACKAYENSNNLCLYVGAFCVLISFIIARYCLYTTRSIQNRKARMSAWWVSFLLFGAMLSSGCCLLTYYWKDDSSFLYGSILLLTNTIVAILVLHYLRSKSYVEDKWDYLMPNWLFPNAGRKTKLFIHLMFLWPIVYLLPAPCGWFPSIIVPAGVFLTVLYQPIRFVKYVWSIAKGK